MKRIKCISLSEPIHAIQNSLNHPQDSQGLHWRFYISRHWKADGPYLGLIPIVLKWPVILTLVSSELAVRPLLTQLSMVSIVVRTWSIILPEWSSSKVPREVLFAFWSALSIESIRRFTVHLPADECRGCSCQSSSAWLRICEHSILRSMNMVTMASSVVTASVMMYWNRN